MAEQQSKVHDRPAAECYYTEHVRLPAEGDPTEAILQEAMNEGARQSWPPRRCGQGPAEDEGFLLVWDTSGPLSG